MVAPFHGIGFGFAQPNARPKELGTEGLGTPIRTHPDVKVPPMKSAKRLAPGTAQGFGDPTQGKSQQSPKRQLPSILKRSASHASLPRARNGSKEEGDIGIHRPTSLPPEPAHLNSNGQPSPPKPSRPPPQGGFGNLDTRAMTSIDRDQPSTEQATHGRDSDHDPWIPRHSGGMEQNPPTHHRSRSQAASYPQSWDQPQLSQSFEYDGEVYLNNDQAVSIDSHQTWPVEYHLSQPVRPNGDPLPTQSAANAYGDDLFAPRFPSQNPAHNPPHGKLDGIFPQQHHTILSNARHNGPNWQEDTMEHVEPQTTFRATLSASALEMEAENKDLRAETAYLRSICQEMEANRLDLKAEVADLQVEQKSAIENLSKLHKQLSAKDDVEARLKIRGRQLAAAYKTATEQIEKKATSMKELYDKRVSKLEDEVRSAADDVRALREEKDRIVHGCPEQGVLGLHQRLEESIEKRREAQTAMRELLKEQEQLSMKMRAYENRAAAHQEEQDKAKAQCKALSARHEELKAKATKMESELLNMNSDMRKHLDAMAKSAETQSKLREAELEVKDKDVKLVSLVNRLAILGVKLDESGNLVEDDEEALQSETARLRTELEQAKADGLHRLGEAVKDKKKVEAELREVQGAFQSMESQLKTAKGKADDLQATLKTSEMEAGTLRVRMKEEEDKCSRLQRQIEQLVAEKETLSRSLQASVANGDIANAMLKDKEASATLAETKTEREQLQADVARLLRDLHHKEGHCERLEMEKAQLEDTVKAQSTRVTDASGGMTGLHDELATLQAEKRLYEKKITELQFANMSLKEQYDAILQREDSSRADRLQSALETATQEKAQAVKALAEAKRRLEESEARLVELARDAKSMRERFDAGNATKEEQAMYQWIDQVARDKGSEERSSLANRLKKSEHENAKLTATVKQLQATIQADASSSRSTGNRTVDDDNQLGGRENDQLSLQPKKLIEAEKLKQLGRQTQASATGKDETRQKASAADNGNSPISNLSSAFPNKGGQASSSCVNQDGQPIKSGVHKPFKSPISAALQNSSLKAKPGFENMASGMAGSGHLLLKTPGASSTAKAAVKEMGQDPGKPLQEADPVESPIEQFPETQATQERAPLQVPGRLEPRAQRTSRNKNANYVDRIVEDLGEGSTVDDHRPMPKRKSAGDAPTRIPTLDAANGPSGSAAKKARFSTQIPPSSDGVPDDVSMGQSDDFNAVRVNDEIEDEFDKMEKGKAGSVSVSNKPNGSDTRARPRGTGGVGGNMSMPKKANSSRTKTYANEKGSKGKGKEQADDTSELSEDDEEVEMSMPPSTQLRSRRTSSRALR